MRNNNSILNVFRCVNIRLIVDNDNTYITFNDIETDKPIILRSIGGQGDTEPIYNGIMENYSGYIRENGNVPGNAIIIGVFVENETSIDWIANEVCIVAFTTNKYHACYIQEINNKLLLFDKITNERIIIDDNKIDKLVEMLYKFNLMANDNEYNEDDFVVIVSGKLIDIKDSCYIYKYDESTIFGCDEDVYAKIYKSISSDLHV